MTLIQDRLAERTARLVRLREDSRVQGIRYVLGPAVMTSQAIASATAVETAGRWVVDWTTKPSGSAL